MIFKTHIFSVYAGNNVQNELFILEGNVFQYTFDQNPRSLLRFIVCLEYEACICPSIALWQGIWKVGYEMTRVTFENCLLIWSLLLPLVLFPSYFWDSDLLCL